MYLIIQTQRFFSFYTLQLYAYAIMMLIAGNYMNAFLKIDSYTATEKLIANYILQQVLDEKTITFATAIIRFSKKIWKICLKGSVI